jgi:hypothetical protein
MDDSLARNPGEFRRIIVHELFHFVWARLGNPARQSYSELIDAELERRARGELGWSSEMRKDAFRELDPVARSWRPWREYVCESFCDTGAWYFSGLRKHPEFTLSHRFRKHRAHWFSEYFQGRKLSI